jgi:hypothetical protein
VRLKLLPLTSPMSFALSLAEWVQKNRFLNFEQKLAAAIVSMRCEGYSGKQPLCAMERTIFLHVAALLEAERSLQPKSRRILPDAKPLRDASQKLLLEDEGDVRRGTERLQRELSERVYSLFGSRRLFLAQKPRQSFCELCDRR